MKAVKYILYVVFAVLLLLEVLLRFYDPFAFRQQGDRVILPRNRKMIFTNESVPGIDSHITHTKNSLGFRGPEPPENWNNYTTIIAVGGSTTECFYLSDSQCWTNLLQHRLGSNYWVNNAGYQGHSTYGNFILVNDYIKQLKPNYILLLEGINEIDRSDLLPDESVSGNAAKTTAWGWLKRNSRVVDLILNLQRHFLADRLNVSDNYFDVSAAPEEILSNEQVQNKLNAQAPLANAYAQRLTKIIDTCLANNITPVLITQPMLFGMTKDCNTGVDLSKINN